MRANQRHSSMKFICKHGPCMQIRGTPACNSYAIRGRACKSEALQHAFLRNVGGAQRHPLALLAHKRQSDVIRGKQRQTEANRGKQRQTEAIRGHQRHSSMQSEAIRCNQTYLHSSSRCLPIWTWPSSDHEALLELSSSRLPMRYEYLMGRQSVLISGFVRAHQGHSAPDYR